jgi:hypothetical protein
MQKCKRLEEETVCIAEFQSLTMPEKQKKIYFMCDGWTNVKDVAEYILF